MGIVFKKIVVDDFISIGHAEMAFKNGVYLVQGVNRDQPDYVKDGAEASISNGAGKTTMFSAVYQGLFNKNSKDSKATVSNVNNFYTKKPYRIEIEFEKDGDTYKILNDRNSNKIDIFKNNDYISPKGITNQLILIKNVIGFDFQTFASLTFLNQSSLDSIIDLTNKDNIVYQFFDIEALNSLEKNLKARKKATNENIIAITSQLSVYKKQLAIFEDGEDIDLSVLESQKSRIKASLDEVEKQYASKTIKALEGSIAAREKELSGIAGQLPFIKRDGERLKAEIDKFKQGVCPTCGQDYQADIGEMEEELANLRNQYKVLNEEFEEKDKELEKLKEKLSERLATLDESKAKFTKQLRDVQVRILVEEDRREQREKVKSNIVELEKEIEILRAELPDLEKDLKVYDTLLAVIKSGAVVNEYLRKYQLLFVKNFRDLQQYTTFAIDIKIKVNKGKMTYIFVDDGVEKPFSLLSAGERTRVSLMLLLATLKTIEQLTNITINYLVLDELLGVLDGEGINFLKNVLSTMRETKCIYIISHHNEIEDSFADGIITVTKENNISRIEDA